MIGVVFNGKFVPAKSDTGYKKYCSKLLQAHGMRSDISNRVWQIGENLSTPELTKFLSALLRAIDERGSSMTVDDANAVRTMIICTASKF